MVRTPDPARLEVARRRLRSVLREQVVSTQRTLEQKISDAGPGPMRIDPHLLTVARKQLTEEGVIVRRMSGSATPWFHLATAQSEAVDAKLAVLVPIYQRLQARDVLMRIGQALEIAVFRALIQQPLLQTFGGFTDLSLHDDSRQFIKEEPPSTISGRSCSPLKLDFIVIGQGSQIAGIEVKNVREWLYPNRTEVREFIKKCTALDVIPVLVARRIPYVTFKLLNACGAVIHQTYNQRFAEADAELAAQVKHKDMLGYHDVRTGNQPDARLLKFANSNLPGLISTRRPLYDQFKDLLQAYGNGDMSYASFAARVRRRTEGTNEETDSDDDSEEDEYY